MNKQVEGKRQVSSSIDDTTGVDAARTNKFVCSVCGKGFDKKWNFEIHSRVHTGVKPFKCSICDKAFTQKGSAKVHMLVHLKRGVHWSPVSKR